MWFVFMFGLCSFTSFISEARETMDGANPLVFRSHFSVGSAATAVITFSTFFYPAARPNISLKSQSTTKPTECIAGNVDIFKIPSLFLPDPSFKYDGLIYISFRETLPKWQHNYDSI